MLLEIGATVLAITIQVSGVLTGVRIGKFIMWLNKSPQRMQFHLAGEGKYGAEGYY
jgi:hypothetical protein